MDSLRLYAVSVEGSPERRQISKVLCQEFLQLHGQPFVIKVMKMMVGITQALVSLTTATNAIKHRVQNKKLNITNKLQTIQASDMDAAAKAQAIEQATKVFEQNKKTHKEQRVVANARVSAKLAKQLTIVNNIVSNYEQTIKVNSNKNPKSRKLNSDSSMQFNNLFSLDAEILVLENDNLEEIIKGANRHDSASKQVQKSSIFGIPMNLTLAFP